MKLRVAKLQPDGNEPFAWVAKGGAQAFALLPNPNNGNFIVQQLVADESAIEAEVWNVVGMRMHKATLYFKGNRAQVNMRNLVPGSYLLKLRDNNGGPYIIKFTVL